MWRHCTATPPRTAAHDQNALTHAPELRPAPGGYWSTPALACSIPQTWRLGKVWAARRAMGIHSAPTTAGSGSRIAAAPRSCAAGAQRAPNGHQPACGSSRDGRICAGPSRERRHLICAVIVGTPRLDLGHIVIVDHFESATRIRNRDHHPAVNGTQVGTRPRAPARPASSGDHRGQRQDIYPKMNKRLPDAQPSNSGSLTRRATGATG
jgi:hypothetical protein